MCAARWAKERDQGSQRGLDTFPFRDGSPAGLDSLQIEEIVILAPHHIRESSQIRHNGSIAVLTVQAYHCLAQRKRLSFHVRDFSPSPLPQFSSVVAVARSSVRADPLVRMCLEHGGPDPDHFPPLASCIARSTDLAQPALCWRAIRRARYSSLASNLPCAIDIEHHPMVSLSIPQPAWLLRFFQRASQ